MLPRLRPGGPPAPRGDHHWDRPGLTLGDGSGTWDLSMLDNDELEGLAESVRKAEEATTRVGACLESK